MHVIAEHEHFTLAERPDGVLYIQVNGSAFDVAQVTELFEVFQPALQAKAPARVLLNLEGLRETSLASRWEVAMRMRSNRQYIQKTAIYGMGPTQRIVVNVVLRASGRSDVTVCDSREEAELALAA